MSRKVQERGRFGLCDTVWQGFTPVEEGVSSGVALLLESLRMSG